MFKKDIHYSLEVEGQVLGACILEPHCFARIYGQITEEVFYNEDHKTIFKILKEVFDNGTPSDIVSIVDYISRVKGIKDFNGSTVAYFIVHLTTPVTSTLNIEYHAHILKQMWIDRELISLTHSGMKDRDSRDAIVNLQNKLTELSMSRQNDDWLDMDDVMVGLLKHQDQMIQSGGKGLLTGLQTIDNNYGGFFEGQFVILAARPSIGKSALAAQISLNMARSGKRVGFLSLEMNNNEVGARMASIDSGIDFKQIFRSLFDDEHQRDKFYQTVNNSTSRLKISISDTTGVNLSEIRAKALKLKYKHPDLSCIIIDYLQLVEGDVNNNRNRENEVSKISRGCKTLAKELKMPLIALCQLNREVEKRTGKNRYPQLSDLRESGSLEQDADIVMFLHSDYKSGVTQNENGFSTENEADLVIRKWRNGEANRIVRLEFDGPKMQFREMFANTNIALVKEDDLFK